MRYLFALVLLAFAATADAQITAEVITLYRVGQTAPASAPVVLNRAQRVCGETLEAVPGLVINPRIFEWPDPSAPATACEWTDPGTGILAMLPVDGSYEATIRFRTPQGDGPEGPRSNPTVRIPAAGQVRVRSGS